MIPRVLVIGLCILLSSCASPSFIVARTYPPTSPDQIVVLFEIPSEPFEVIAKGSVHAIGAGSYNRNTQKAMAGLKLEAARMGGDAVIIEGPATQSTAIFGTASGGSAFAIAGGAGDSTVQAAIIRYKR